MTFADQLRAMNACDEAINCAIIREHFTAAMIAERMKR